MKYKSETSAVVRPFNVRELANPLTITVTTKARMLRLCSKIVFIEFDIIKGSLGNGYKILVASNTQSHNFHSQTTTI